MNTVGYRWIQLDTLGYSWIQLDTVAYSWIQLDTVGYSWIQLDLDTAGYSCPMALAPKFSNIIKLPVPLALKYSIHSLLPMTLAPKLSNIMTFSTA